MQAIRIYIGLAALVASVFLAGCGSKPPGCADAQTIATVKEIVVDNTAKHLRNDQRLADDPDGWLRRFYDGLKVEVNLIVSEGYKADAKKQLCRGTLKVVALTGDTAERAIEYSTQMTEDKKSAFLVEIQDFAPFIEATAKTAKDYFYANRWTGAWHGTYACSGMRGAPGGAAGPYSMPVTLVVEGDKATLERLTRGGGIEILEGSLAALKFDEHFRLRGEGENSEDDTWKAQFEGKIQGRQLTADGQIYLANGEVLRQCQLKLALSETSAAASTSAAMPSAGFAGSYRTALGNITAEIGAADSKGQHPVEMITSIPTPGGGSCGGHAQGVGTIVGGALKVVAENEYSKAEGQKCEILLSVGGPGKLEIEEGNGCHYFHGAACDFVGSLLKVK